MARRMRSFRICISSADIPNRSHKNGIPQERRNKKKKRTKNLDHTVTGKLLLLTKSVTRKVLKKASFRKEGYCQSILVSRPRLCKGQCDPVSNLATAGCRRGRRRVKNCIHSLERVLDNVYKNKKRLHLLA